MNEKEKHIIEIGMKLFAEQGYYKTSIQDIATSAGISKGAFYLHFSSKETFMVCSIQHFHDKIVRKIKSVNHKSCTPKECLAKQITEITKYIYQYRDFIIMHLREDFLIGEHTEKLFHEMRIENVKWLKTSIYDIYGADIEGYLMDLVIQLDGLMKSYFHWIVIDKIQIDTVRFGTFIVDRMDDLCASMTEQKTQPIVISENLPETYQDLILQSEKSEQLNEILTEMNGKITRLQLDSDTKKRLFEVVQMIANKTAEQTYETITIQGLLAHFNHIPELQEQCKSIAKLLDVKRLI